MKTDIGHLPQAKQRELERVVRIIHEEFTGIVERSKSEAKKDGRIYKIILFGSYARGTWVDEPHTSKGYRSDFDILVIVSNKELADPKYWDKATDRLMWDKEIETPVGLIVHGAREISNFYMMANISSSISPAKVSSSTNSMIGRWLSRNRSALPMHLGSRKSILKNS